MDGTTEEITMHLPRREGEFKWNLNTLVTLGGIIIGFTVTAIGWGVTYADMRNADSNTQGQIADLRSQFEKDTALRQGLAPQVQQLTYQTTRALEASAENKKSIEDVNSKIGSKLDSLIDQINRLSTQVQVLGSKFDDMQGKTDHTIFPRLPISAQK
jgi:hypothetical protein